MKEIKICTLHLNKEDKEVFNRYVKELGSGSSVIHCNTISNLEKKLQRGMVLFYAFDSSMKDFESELEQIHNFNIATSMNILFYKQQFQALARAFHYNINHILEKNYTSEDIHRALLKFELKRKSKEKLPLKALQYLLETPIKVKTDEQMFRYLKNYFNQILKISKFCVIKQTNKEFDFLYGNNKFDLKSIQNEIKKVELTAKPIGVVYSIPKINIYFFPIYILEDEVAWGVIETKIDETDVFNDIFLKFLENVHLYRKIKERVEDLKELANTDEITGLYNQRKLAVDLDNIIKEHKELNKEFSVMFIDVDHFKDVNDNYGHVVGSQMLIEIGSVIKQLLRGSDLVYRYGGDEFVAIMTKVKTEIVHKIALRVLKSVKAMDFPLENGDIYKLSISIGIAEYPKNAKTAKEMIQFADEMMYESKKAGRGRVFHLSEVSDASTSS